MAGVVVSVNGCYARGLGFGKFGKCGLLKHVRLGLVRQATTSSIVGPRSFLCQFFKFSEKNSRKASAPGILEDERTD
jgi:hypothetical protein